MPPDAPPAVTPPAGPRDLASLLQGQDPYPGIVAVEPAGGNAVTLYRRLPQGQLATETAPAPPWLIVPETHLDLVMEGKPEVVPLAGQAQLNRLVVFAQRTHFARAQATLRGVDVPHFSYGSPVAQYLTFSGRTLFYGMRFDDLHRVQLDVETTTLRPEAPDAGVLLVALTDNRGYEAVLTARDGGEDAMLRELSARIAALDPDVIEGHNLLDFDLPYLATRAARLGVPLRWGRDGQPLWLQEREGRYKVGARILPSMRVHIQGRHILDTFQQIQRYDSQGKLESYALKSVMEALELVRAGREFVDRSQITRLWETAPERLARYCLDDARDVRTLAELVTPTEFYQTQIVPRSYQDVATGGTGEKINALMVRAYLANRHAIPLPNPPRPFPGGYTEVRAAGVFRRVVKCDVESLYPAVMLHYGYKPASDTLDVFLPILAELTRRRLHAKGETRRTRGPERAYWTGLSSSYKVLINSFYGFLAYSRANFNDFDAAEQVTTTGQKLIKDVLAALEARGCQIIEVDTDGVYFVPPPGVDGEAAEMVFVEEIGRTLPEGINLAHDGRYAGMVSLKQKTYFLLTYDGRPVATGSSLRSRRDERYLRRFFQEAAVTLINGSLEDVSRLYLELGERIQGGELQVEEFARRESITAKTHTSPGLRRLATAARGIPVGQQVQVYQREDGSLALIGEYAGDEDRDYLLRRLHDMAKRFAALCEGGAKGETFQRLFPRLTARREPSADRPVQLSLF
ncbi:MAG TPA: 3'-5' exonuclease [Chloroflexota bacterium]|nr:3'-5' exonuclease [Chloroflexota bacterium]